MKNITCPIIPAPGYIVVAPLTDETIGSFTISDNIKERDLAGVVLAVGKPKETILPSGIHTTPSPVKAGDTIIHSTYYAAPYNHQGKRYRLVKFEEVQGVLI